MWQLFIAAGQALFQWLLPRLFAAVGTATVSATVYTPTLNWVQGKITSSLGGLSADAYGFIQYVGIPNAISIIFAAVTVQLGLRASKAAFAKKGATDNA